MIALETYIKVLKGQSQKFVLALLALCLTALAGSAATPATLAASADSTTLVQGDRVTVNLNLVKDADQYGALVGMPEKKKDYFGLEMIEYSCDTTQLGNNREEIKYHIIFQAFDPAEILTLPPFAYAVGSDTVRSDILTFKVLPVDLSPELGDINNIDSLTVHPSEKPIAAPARWYDWVPDWWIWVMLGLVVIALATALYMLYKKNGPAIFTPRKPVPPYELAMQRMAVLKSRRLLEQGQVKTYYTDLIDIMRNYLQGRFGINAMEMTSKQILKRLRENKEMHLSTAQIEQALQLADIVKFAAANPTPEEGLRTYNTISDFLESTKPVAEEENAADNNATKAEGNAPAESKHKKPLRRK